jgi:hypothetical protein
MQAIAKEIESGRSVFCETHSRYCEFVSRSSKCACCGKRVCLCNYVL